MKLESTKLLTLYYHDRFGFPMTKEDLERWEGGGQVKIHGKKIVFNKGYFFFEGRSSLVKTRKIKEGVSRKKLFIAKKAAKVLGKIPTIKMVGVTGSLAMMNARPESDIDLMVITQGGQLWVTRIMSYLLLKLFGFKLRKPGIKKEKDRLCLNLWLDESDLVWPEGERNIFTAHEIAQVIPLVNKDKTYERFLWQNRWLLDYWPRSVKIIKTENRLVENIPWLIKFFEKLMYRIQHLYMKNKITKEVVTPTRAIFHPKRFPLDKLGPPLLE